MAPILRIRASAPSPTGTRPAGMALANSPGGGGQARSTVCSVSAMTLARECGWTRNRVMGSRRGRELSELDLGSVRQMAVERGRPPAGRHAAESATGGWCDPLVAVLDRSGDLAGSQRRSCSKAGPCSPPRFREMVAGPHYLDHRRPPPTPVPSGARGYDSEGVAHPGRPHDRPRAAGGVSSTTSRPGAAAGPATTGSVGWRAATPSTPASCPGPALRPGFGLPR